MMPSSEPELTYSTVFSLLSDPSLQDTMATRRGRGDVAAGAASKTEEQDRGGGVSERREARQSGEWGVGAAPIGLLRGDGGGRHRQTPSNGCRDGRRCHIRKK